MSIKSFSLIWTICIFSSSNSASGRVYCSTSSRPTKDDRVAEIQLVEENIDMPSKSRVMEDHAPVAEQLGDLFVFLVTQLGQYPA